eukprot:Tamp_10014.p1 GENE.Tamp_10014~~Tamp_10014.p1  ORF type:complete len:597 (-),score=33.26 Tamp_10014:86-1876(-)
MSGAGCAAHYIRQCSGHLFIAVVLTLADGSVGAMRAEATGSLASIEMRLPPDLRDLTTKPQSLTALTRKTQYAARVNSTRPRPPPRRAARCEHVQALGSASGALDACRKRPCYGAPGSTTAVRCAQHRWQGDVDLINALCQYRDASFACSKTAAFGGTDTQWRRRFCTAHRRKEHVNLVSHRRPAGHRAPAPQRSQGSHDARPEHALALRLSDASQTADGAGHIKSRIFELEAGQGEGLEAKQGEAATEFPRCQWTRADGSDTCWRRALFVGKGREGHGLHAAERCAFHRTPGMQPAIARCTYVPATLHAGTARQGASCGRAATYGPPVHSHSLGRRVVEPLFCAIHRLASHRSVHSSWCRAAGCPRIAGYGQKGKCAAYCRKHKGKTDCDVRHPRCRAAGCSTAANFGPLAGPRLFCARHKECDHVSFAQRRPLLLKWLAEVPAATRSPEQHTCQQLLCRTRHAPSLSPSSPRALHRPLLALLEPTDSSADGREEGGGAAAPDPQAGCNAKAVNGGEGRAGGGECAQGVVNAAWLLPAQVAQVPSLLPPSHSSAPPTCSYRVPKGRRGAGFWMRVEAQLRCAGLLSSPVTPDKSP